MKKKLWLYIGLVLLTIGLVFAGIGIKQYLEEKNAGDDYERIKSDISTVKTTSQPENTPDVKSTDEKKEPVVIPVDLDKLMKKYPDVYAWIRIHGTDIDYPIVQSDNDNSYYLNHTIEGKEKIEGAIFTEDYNSKDFSDPNTVIYGHNMKNGSMFRQLHRYEDREFFKKNQEVLIYQKERILHYQIFAAYIYDNRHLMESFDFSDPDVFENYIDNVFSLKTMYNNIDDSLEITSEDKIITLSTCTGNDDQRYLVQAVLLSIEE